MKSKKKIVKFDLNLMRILPDNMLDEIFDVIGRKVRREAKIDVDMYGEGVDVSSLVVPVTVTLDLKKIAEENEE